MNIKYSIAFYAIDLLDVQGVISLAECLMVDGCSSNSLNMLAAEDSAEINRIEIRHKMDRVLEELNVELPAFLDAVKLCICYWCENILSDEVSPNQGVKAIVENVFQNTERFENGDRYGQAFDAGIFYSHYDFYDEMDYYKKTGNCTEDEPVRLFEGKEYNMQEAIEYVNNQVVLEAHNYLNKYADLWEIDKK